MAARKTAALFGIELSGQQLQRGTLAFHYGLAISWAPLYQVLRRKTGLGPLRAGLAMGPTMSLVADEINGAEPRLHRSQPGLPAGDAPTGCRRHLVSGSP